MRVLRHDRIALLILTPLLALAGAAGAATESGVLLNDTVTMSLGTFVVGTDTQVRVDGEGGQQGTEIDLKRDFGFKDQTRFRLDGSWRFAARHKLRFLYFENNLDRTRNIDRDITIGDTTYPVDGSVSLKSGFTIIEAAYEYSFLKRDNWELAGTIGVHQVKFNLDFAGDGTCTGESCPPDSEVSFRKESNTVKGPLPVLGLHGLWEFAPSWYLDGQGQWFRISLDGFDGRLRDIRLGVTKMFTPHFGAGAGWNNFETDVDVDKDAFSGQLNWGYSGLMLYLTGTF